MGLWKMYKLLFATYVDFTDASEMYESKHLYLHSAFIILHLG